MSEPTTEQAAIANEIERLLAAARDSANDEMVSRLAGTVGDAVDLIDQVNRSGLAKAIPAFAALVSNGDLDRLTKLARVYGAAEDAISEEMVGRLAGTVGDALDFADQVNRSGLAKAIPAFAALVHNGDLDRLAKLARVYGAAEDAISEEMVGRLAETAAEGLSLLDRLSRGGAFRMVEMLAKLEASGSLRRIAETLPRLAEKLGMLERMLHAFEIAATQTAEGPRPAGGLGGMYRLMADPGNQESLQYLINVGKELRTHPPR
jgi:Asp-tRNA(Asn)/Glu-tRNA(Gln) amidotransferase C subunit